MRTLAEILKTQGYATAGFTGNAGVSGNFGYDQGFDVYYYPRGKFGQFAGSVPRALDWLYQNRDRKFFLFLHGYDVHGQSTPEEYDYRYVDKDYDGRYKGSESEQEILREEGLEKGKVEIRPQDVKFWRAIYDEKINRADAKFLYFLREYYKLGLTDKTLFVLTSDHGTEFYEHQRFDHGFTLYQELVHVPLIIRLPGQQVGTKIESRVGSIDVLPTILDLLEVPLTDQVREQLRGESLVPIMKGKEAKRNIFSETNYRDYTFQRSITTPDGWKLIYVLEKKKRELYNLTDDPKEQKNLVELEVERADELEKKLFAAFQVDRSRSHEARVESRAEAGVSVARKKSNSESKSPARETLIAN